MKIKEIQDNQNHAKVSINLLIFGAIIIAALLKFWLVKRDVLPFNSDEAVVALMARHILRGARPIFFYGQAYMGSLDAWFVAVGFRIFGEHIWVIRFVQTLLYLGIMLTTYQLGWLALGSRRVGLAAIWLMAIPNVIVSLYTTVSLGGYGEGLLLGNIILILGLKISARLQKEDDIGLWRWFLWGTVVGISLWVFGITLVFSLPMGMFLLLQLFRKKGKISIFLLSKDTRINFLQISLGFVLGSVPWWLYAYQNGLKSLLDELGGSAVAVDNSPWLYQFYQHLRSLIVFGGTAAFGLRPSWEIRWLVIPLLPVVLAFWLGVLFFILNRFRSGKNNRFGAGVLLGTMMVLAIGFTVTSFGADPSGRYFVPLVIPLSLFAGEMIVSLSDRYGPLFYGFVGLILVYNFCGIAQSADRHPPGITTQFNQITQVDSRNLDEVIQFLEKEGETRGYTNYWVAYPLAFQSEERLIFIPRLPYHEDFRYTSRDDRYEPYTRLVESEERAGYITTNHPALNDYLRDAFSGRSITWLEKQIGDYNIFYNLSSIIRPQDIGL